MKYLLIALVLSGCGSKPEVKFHHFETCGATWFCAGDPRCNDPQFEFMCPPKDERK